MSQENEESISMAMFCCHVERTLPVHVHHINRRAVLEQELDDVDVVVSCRTVERCPSHPVGYEGKLFLFFLSLVLLEQTSETIQLASTGGRKNMIGEGGVRTRLLNVLSIATHDDVGRPRP